MQQLRFLAGAFGALAIAIIVSAPPASALVPDDEAAILIVPRTLSAGAGAPTYALAVPTKTDISTPDKDHGASVATISGSNGGQQTSDLATVAIMTACATTTSTPAQAHGGPMTSFGSASTVDPVATAKDSGSLA